MQLIGSLASPFVRKVRVVLAEKKLDYDFVLDNPWAADAQVRKSNPLGQVPCLIMDGGEAVFDSRVIVEYLDTLSPVGKLLPAAGRDRIEVKTWEALADGLLDAAISARLEKTWAGRTDAERSPAWMARKLAAVEATLAAMHTALGDKPYCFGVNLSLADIAVACALDWLDFRFPELQAWHTQYPNLRDLQQRCAERPSFQATAPSAG
jgi:glutathione S-transferase